MSYKANETLSVKADSVSFCDSRGQYDIIKIYVMAHRRAHRRFSIWNDQLHRPIFGREANQRPVPYEHHWRGAGADRRSGHIRHKGLPGIFMVGNGCARVWRILFGDRARAVVQSYQDR